MEATDNSALRIVGGHTGLDLVNTVEPRVPGAEPEKEHLNTPEELLEWAVRTRVVEPVEAREIRLVWQGEAALAAVLAIREALYAVLLARLNEEGGPILPYQPALEQLGTRYAAAVARGGLTLPPDSPTIGRLRLGDVAAFAVQDRLAAIAVDLLTRENIEDLRQCPLDEGGCGWLFLDRSRNHSRRWCAMADCGTRVKARRLTVKRRGRQLPPK
ncbi:CGNR zinc finger domain-containing protein [Dactylosporangium vinaceum]|uniref:CGNR zinc finger domain-containing protein n=1 Tax=Dactylosporangium vinaceum TaxID=53362 RepID=A0ABV5MGH9_9ACTN|nr:CGNR zinc finger domain-containing protein [Dactylosporangium vinaceum]UAB99083.1 CGNR zinc finger domain-containing protein [Dactylosporangium vinaceum]